MGSFALSLSLIVNFSGRFWEIGKRKKGLGFKEEEFGLGGFWRERFYQFPAVVVLGAAAAGATMKSNLI